MFRLAVLALAFAATPATASSHYQAQPSARPAADRVVAKNTLWRCSDAGCSAMKSNSRPAVVCAALVKEIGTLRSFSVAGQPLPAVELEKCNTRAA